MCEYSQSRFGCCWVGLFFPQSIVFGLCACTRARAAGGKRSGCARSKLGRDVRGGAPAVGAREGAGKSKMNTVCVYYYTRVLCIEHTQDTGLHNMRAIC